MATIFKGMSKDNFLDRLVEKTGKNGHELYDYLVSLLERSSLDKASTQKAATGNCNGKYEFSGSRQEFIDLLKLRGGDCYGIGAVSPYGLCIYAARIFGVNQFVWHRPAQKKDANGNLSYTVITEEAFLDNEGNEIFTH